MERILVIDDDLMNAKATRFTLERNGYEVACATSGAAGLAMLEGAAFDLVLLDIMMPDMSGIEVLRQMRETPQLAATKVVFLTASTSRTDIVEAAHLAASQFVQKPSLPEELLAAVRTALDESVDDTLLLIVDDDPMSQKITRRALEPPYRVACVDTGDAAVEFCKGTEPSLILMDLYLPGTDGLTAFHQIKALPNCHEVPVMFLTVDDNVDIERKILQAGAVDFVRKPFVAEVVQERVSRVLELERLQHFLHEEVERRTVELQESMRKVRRLTKQVIFALANAIDAKDAYTNGHSSRVAEYSRMLAQRMGKVPEEVEDIYFAAILHDVGKIGIPKEIITKTTRLTDEEFAVIKEHSVVGDTILRTISELPSLSVAARWHHERYDGRGYPDGLAGVDIPELARIICVADSYDAMTSNRSYRGALSQEAVRHEIMEGRGTQFDPRIADLMIQIIDEDTNYDLHEK